MGGEPLMRARVARRNGLDHGATAAPAAIVADSGLAANYENYETKPIRPPECAAGRAP
jgi:hypothetical protein